MAFLRELEEYVWSRKEWRYPKMTEETYDMLRQCLEVPPINMTYDVEDIIERSRAFPIKFPIQVVRLERLKKKRPQDRLKSNINTTYPIIHERALHMMTHFLIYKRKFGSPIEKPFYKDMTVPQLIDRILKKRAVSFMYPEDHYKLLSGESGEEGWEEVGTQQQQRPLVLENVLSYDELKLSALVAVSGFTECVNEASRHNSGVVREEDAEPNALIIGLIGPRFERLNRMDYEDMILTGVQNVPENGYGDTPTPVRFAHVLNNTYVHGDDQHESPNRHMWRQMWAEFFEVENYTYEEIDAMDIRYKSVERQYKERFIKLSIAPECETFDNEVYYKRLLILAETLLLEADWRAKERGQSAFVNIVGLGVWKISLHQTDMFMLSFMERVHALLQTNMLNHVSDVNFSYLRPTQGVLDLFNIYSDTELPRKLFLENKQHPRGGINVQLENREPASRLTGEHEGKMLVLTYPWDSNAHPGNEFWLGYLTGSGDPAAACATQISELHNANISPLVCCGGARVAGRHGVETLHGYCANTGE
ncbi:uncharacterized protein [Epargyreus clarus]|uniref:uncharacterized protein isoform X4 n=1 Tax=Epargyreus clarus TaxID=520877 RepID=UPI003C2B7389